MDETYIFSMREHLGQLQIELEGLSCIIGQRDLNCYEYRAAERTLQILIEACIGIAKHWNYLLFKTAPANAYAAFENLSQQNINALRVIEWRKIIGMRNALVHDYLNIDPEIIRSVIEKKIYTGLFEFATQGLLALECRNLKD